MSDNVVSSQLPREGEGFKAYKKPETQWGTQSTIDFIKALGAAWKAANPNGPRLMIGDISVRGGGPTPNGGRNPDGTLKHHKSHREGRDFDVQLVRPDEGVRTTRISDPATLEATRPLVELINNLARDRLQLILVATHQFGSRQHVVFDATHEFHLHVRLRP